MRFGFAAVAGILAVGLMGPARADAGTASCPDLAALVADFTGYAVDAPPAGDAAGWCVLDRARLTSDRADQPDLTVDLFRMKGRIEDGVPVAIEIRAEGLRLVKGLGAKQLDEDLQAMFRLQSADLSLAAQTNAEAGSLEIRGLRLALSGGSEVEIAADLAGAGLSPLGLAVGRVTLLDLRWKTDGRLLRPVMEAAGAKAGLSGSEAVAQARQALTPLVEALPPTLLTKDSRDALIRLIAGLPEGRGVLDLTYRGDPGIGAADLLLAGLADDPLAAEVLIRLFAGATLQASWSPGLQP